MSDDDVTLWIKEARQGDQDAAKKIWVRYVHQLLKVARARWKNMPRRTVDEDDVVQSAMKSFFRHLSGNLLGVENRDELWRVLVTITHRKVIATQRRQFAQKRGGGLIGSTEQEVMDINHLVSAEPSPEFAVLVAEECACRMESLSKVDVTLVNVAQLKLEGYTNEEIAQRLSRTKRSVERKLNRIRSIWSEDREA